MKKFIKIQANHTEKEIALMIEKLDQNYLDFLLKLYSTFDYVELVDCNDKVYMYAIVTENQEEELIKHYNILAIDFKHTDLTKEVKFHDTSFFPAKEREAKLVTLIHNFIYHNVCIDDVLDKICELGDSNLTDLDKQILKNI